MLSLPNENLPAYQFRRQRPSLHLLGRLPLWERQDSRNARRGLLRGRPSISLGHLRGLLDSVPSCFLPTAGDFNFFWVTSDSRLFSNPDPVECRIAIGRHHLCANTVGRECPHTQELIGSRWWCRVWNRVGHKRLSHGTRVDVCPTHNKLVVWLIPTQLRYDSLSDAYATEADASKELALPVHESYSLKLALGLCRIMFDVQKSLHVVVRITASAVEEVPRNQGLRSLRVWICRATCYVCLPHG